MTKTAIIFPGQGAQKVGMLQDFQEIAIEMAQQLEIQGYSANQLLHLINNGSKEELDLTTNTQPALCFTKAVMIEALRRELNIEFHEFKNYVAITTGHSLGEYTALYFSGVITLLEMMNLVTVRAKLMQEAVPAGTGAMAAILGLSDDDVVTSCNSVASQHQEIVSAVNFNSEGQVVIAGTKNGVALTIEYLKQNFNSVKALPLPVSVPSHCVLMESAFIGLGQEITHINFQNPQIPLIQNTTAEIAENLIQLKEELAQQVQKPVLWTKIVKAMVEKEKVSQIIELGPNKVLTGLIKRCKYELPETTSELLIHNIFDEKTLKEVAKRLT
jgi:[acyl-carrier-protein] S-malonyltransferase